MENIVKKLYNIICIMIFISVALLTLLIPQTVTTLTKEALKICASNIIPSLFPFLVITQILSRTGIADAAGKCVSFIVSPLLGIHKNLCGAFLTGIFGGFPNGVHSTGIAFQKGLCTKKQAERCLALSNNCSLAFLMTIAGAYTLGSTVNGLILAGVQMISILIISLILRFVYGTAKDYTSNCSDDKSNCTFISAICKSVTQSCINMLSVCGYITVFYIISCLLLNGIRNPSTTTAILKGILEMSSGVIMAKDIDYPLNFIITAFIIGFSGICVIFQVTDASLYYGLSSSEFVFSRILNAVLMPVLTAITMIFLPRGCIYTFNSYQHSYIYDIRQPNITAVMLLYAVYLCVVMTLLAIIYYICVIIDKRKKVQK